MELSHRLTTRWLFHSTHKHLPTSEGRIQPSLRVPTVNTSLLFYRTKWRLACFSSVSFLSLGVVHHFTSSFTQDGTSIITTVAGQPSPVPATDDHTKHTKNYYCVGRVLYLRGSRWHRVRP